MGGDRTDLLTLGYAGIASRAAAFGLDALVVVVVHTVGFQVSETMLSAIGAEVGEGLGFLLAIPVTFGLYSVAFWTLAGRTPGKAVLGLRVVTGSGDQPGFKRSVIRALGYWVSSIALVGFAWIALDRRSQGFHDKIAATFVVYDR